MRRFRRRSAIRQVKQSTARAKIQINWDSPDEEIIKQMGPIRRKTGYKGPEPYGCFNTGRAAVIYKALSGYIFVGYDINISDARHAMLFDSNKGKRSIGSGRDKVWVFKTPRPAIRKFLDMVREQLKWNREQLEEHKAAIAKANSSNPEERVAGAMALLDF